MGAGTVVERLPLSVVKPMPASASLIEYGSSFNAFTLRKVSSYYPTHTKQPDAYLRLWTLPFLCASMLASLSKNLAHSRQ